MTDRRGRPAPELPIGSWWDWPGGWAWAGGQITRVEVLSEPFIERGRWWVVVDTEHGWNLAAAIPLRAGGKPCLESETARRKRAVSGGAKRPNLLRISDVQPRPDREAEHSDGEARSAAHRM